MHFSPRAAPQFPLRGVYFLWAALLFGALARFWVPVTGGFVPMDGGMFLVAAREVSAHFPALPATLPYPTIAPTIPFCYPPLAFYLTALLHLAGVPLLLSMRLLPPLFSTLTIWAVWRLARRVFAAEKEGEMMAGVAALFWALTPNGYLWMVMGGGLTRSPGLFFAVLGVERGLAFWRDGEKRAWFHTALFVALALATHLERARFLLIALLLVWLVYGRTARGLGALMGCFLMGALLCAPWWGACVMRFGLGPFRAASRSGGLDWMDGYASQLGVGLGGESLFPVLVCFALGGVLVLGRRRAPFLWVWYLVIWALELRSGVAFISLPIALAAAGFVVSLPRLPRRALFLGATGWLLLQASSSVLALRVLSPDTRAAMAWCAANSPQQARFVVMPINRSPSWPIDLEGEWFPALARRAAPLTVQGAEWLPKGTFAAQQSHYKRIFTLRSWAQMQADLAAFGTRADWIFWPRSKAPTSTRHAVQEQLLADPDWRVAFKNGDVLVLQRASKPGG